MSFLKKFGLTVLKIIGVVSGFEPLLQPYLPAAAGAKVADIFTRISAAVHTAEVVIGAVSDPNAKTGPQKLKAAVPLVAQIIQSSEVVAGKKIRDEQAFIAAVTAITSGVADLYNSLEGDVSVTPTQNVKP